MFKRIVIPLDGSTFAEAALVPATALASVLAAPGKGSLYLTQAVYSGAVCMKKL